MSRLPNLLLLLTLLGRPLAGRSNETETLAAPPQAAPEAIEADGAAACACRACTGPPRTDWSKAPPVRAAPRLGMALIFPTDCGYYSLTDQVLGDLRATASKTPWGMFGFTPISSFDLDYRYLEDPQNAQHDVFDPLKRIHCGDSWLLSAGGQTWIRTMHEVDSRLTTINNNYQLFRTREYLDVWRRDQFRVFAEFIYAESFHSDLSPLPIDVNRADMLNLFGEIKLFGGPDGRAYLRAGRQELLYGSQRLISPLEWANTRRTFQGVKIYYQSERWDFDLFWTQPVVVNRNYWDNVDDDRNLAGAWATRKWTSGVCDLYYLFFDDANPTARGSGGDVGGQSVHTLGARFFAKRDSWMFETEWMLQLGAYANQTKVAASTPVGVGYDFSETAWRHQLWAYYDWASGDRNPGQGGVNSTFQQLFPFGHYYFGYLDLVGRQNIQDVYGQWVFFPEHWLTCLVQFHSFWLASDRDALYTAAGVPIRRDPTGSAGNFVGNELDLLATAQLTRHLNFSIGWSKLFAGRFIAETGPDVSPEFFYTQFNYRW
jgi:hypothetical protein